MDENTYNRLSYVESTGSNYVLTDVIVGGDNFAFEIEFACLSEFSSTNGQYGCVFGARQASTNRDYQLTSFRASGTTRNGTLRYGNSSNQIDALLTKDVVGKCSLKNGVYTGFDGTTTSITLTANETTPCPIAIFALNENGTVSQNGKMRLCYFKVTGTNKSAEYLPAERKSDGVVGLYDEVSGTFLTPTGGALIRGVILGRDNLVLYGNEYEDVSGFKAKDENSNTLIYVNPKGTKSITANGTGIDVASYASVDVSVSGGGTPTLETITKTYTPTESAITETITASSGYDGIEEVDVTVSAVPEAEATPVYGGEFDTNNGNRRWTLEYGLNVDTWGYVDEGGWIDSTVFNAVASGTSVTPTESSQTIGGANYMMEGAVTVNAIPSNYVGSGITQRSSNDVTLSGRTFTAPSGYYSSSASKVMPYANWGEPSDTVTKDYEDNEFVWERTYPSMVGGYTYAEDVYISHIMTLESKSVSPSTSQQVITPTDTNCYLNSVTVSAMPSGTEGTPTATKGTVSNHSVSVTPSVTNSAGYISGGTHTGTAVTVSASELVSGTLNITSSGTTNVTNYASVSVAGQTLPSTVASASVGTSKAQISAGSSTTYLNIPTGYNGLSQFYEVMPLSATAPVGSLSVSAYGTYSAFTYDLYGFDTVTVPSASLYDSIFIVGSITFGLDEDRVVAYVEFGSSVSVVSSAGYINSGETVFLYGNYNSQYTLPTQSLPTSAISTHTGSLVSTILLSTATRYLNIPTGYNASSKYYNIAPINVAPLSVSANGTYSASTYDIDGFNTVNVSIAYATIYSGSSTPSAGTGTNGDVYIQTA